MYNRLILLLLTSRAANLFVIIILYILTSLLYRYIFYKATGLIEVSPSTDIITDENKENYADVIWIHLPLYPEPELLPSLLELKIRNELEMLHIHHMCHKLHMVFAQGQFIALSFGIVFLPLFSFMTFAGLPGSNFVVIGNALFLVASMTAMRIMPFYLSLDAEMQEFIQMYVTNLPDLLNLSAEKIEDRVLNDLFTKEFGSWFGQNIYQIVADYYKELYKTPAEYHSTSPKK